MMRLDAMIAAAKDLDPAARATVREILLHRALGRARRKKRTAKSVNSAKVNFPHRIEESYAAALVKLVGSERTKPALAPLFSELQNLVSMYDAQRGGAAPFIDPVARVHAIIAAAKRVIPGRAAIAAEAQRFGDQVSRHQRDVLSKQIEASLGVKLAPTRMDSAIGRPVRRLLVVKRARMRLDAPTGRVQTFAATQGTMVTSLGVQSLDDIERTIIRGFEAGDRHEGIAAEIEKRFGVFDGYARRMARDRVGSLNGQITADRHQEIGVSSFIWRSMRDERVRELHDEIDGEEYDYPDGHPEEGLPGEPYNCRCVSDPVFDNIVDAVEEAEDDADTEEEGFDLGLPSAFLSEEDVDLVAQQVRAGENPVLAREPQIFAVTTSPIEAPPVHVEPSPPAIAPPPSPEPPPSAPATPLPQLATPKSKEWADEHLKATVTGAQRKAVDAYQGGEYKAVNANLRGTQHWGVVPKKSQELSTGQTIGTLQKNLDKAIDSSPIPEPMIVYRGVSGQSFAPGEIITDKAYQSTSLNPDVAKGFSEPSPGFVNPDAPPPSSHTLEIELPAGQKALHVSGLLGGGEQEILLPRGTSIQVTRVEGTKVYARVISDAEAKKERAALEPPKNPKRVEAAKKAAAAGVERRREIHSAVASNLSPDLQTVWSKEGHKFISKEGARIKGEKDPINAASRISEAFTEQYGSGDQTAHGNEGDHYAKRAEIEAVAAEDYADAETKAYYAQLQREGEEAGYINEHGEVTEAGREHADYSGSYGSEEQDPGDDVPF